MWFKQQKSVFSRFWRLGSPTPRFKHGSVPDEAFVPSLQTATFFLGPLMAFPGECIGEGESEQAFLCLFLEGCYYYQVRVPCLWLYLTWSISCWNSSTLAISCKELTHWKRLWCWEGLGAEGEGDDGGWDGCMASLTWWMWVWVNSGSWWWTGRPGVLQFMGSWRVGHDWATDLIWSDLISFRRSLQIKSQ